MARGEGVDVEHVPGDISGGAEKEGGGARRRGAKEAGQRRWRERGAEEGGKGGGAEKVAEGGRAGRVGEW